MSNTQDLPTGNPETFVGELEEMDLTPLKGKMFGVAVSSGPRDGYKFVCSTLRAPLDFYEMIEMVGALWEREQVHAKAFVLSNKLDAPNQYLDECTIDFIEARYMDIIADGLLDGALENEKQFTCRAGFLDVEEKSEETLANTET